MRWRVLSVLCFALAPAVARAQPDAGGETTEAQQTERERQRSEQDAERARQEAERERQRAREEARRQREQARQQAERERERAREAAQRAREQAREAQEMVKEQMREAEQAMREARQEMRQMLREQRRMGLYPMLGVSVKTDPATRDGVIIEKVVTNGPAAKAGILSGDVLLTVKGQRLIETSDAGLESTAHSVARLLTLVHTARDGEKIPVQYRRGTETHEAQVAVEVPGSRERSSWAAEMSALHRLPFPARWRGFELVGMNPELGEYFGTKTGLLVVRGPPGTKLKLKAGDVILKIGGQPAESPTQAVRVLRSYDSTKPLTLEILRHKRAQKLKLELPKSEED